MGPGTVISRLRLRSVDAMRETAYPAAATMSLSEYSASDRRSIRRNAVLSFALVALACSPLFFFGLGRSGLGDPDEGRNAEAAREILVTRDWVTPHLDGVPYLDKPPAFFWLVAQSYRILGVNELAARAPSALFALAGVLLVFWFARRRIGATAAWLAAATLALSPLYILFARIVIFDMMLTFCMTVSVLCAFEAMEGGGPAAGGRLPAALVFAAAGLGTITKGPVALVVPLLVATAWALVRRRPALLRRLRFGTGTAIYLLLITPWLALVESRHPGYLRYAVIGENLQRMTSNRFETARPFFFYVKVVLPGLFPWVVYAAAAVFQRARGLWSRAGGDGVAPWRRAWERLGDETDAGRLAVAFSGCWLAALLLFFSCVASKRPSYMLPCAMPLAILSGRLWSRAFGRGSERVPDALMTGAGWVAALCGAGALATALAGPAGLAFGFSDGEYDVLLARHTLFGLTSLGLGAACALLLATRAMRRPVAAFASAVLSIAVVVPLARATSAYLDVARSSRPVSRFLAARLRPGDLVVCYEQYRPGLNFYLRRPIHLFTTGTPFSSWYIKQHLDELLLDPSFPMFSGEELRRVLAAPSPAVFVLAPPRMYDLVRALAGPALGPDPLFEDLGVGVFGRAAAPEAAVSERAETHRGG